MLKSDKNYPMAEGVTDVNRKKNRYKDILPYDNSRVILSEYPGVPGSDYINANYVRGSSGNQRAYIACQGPLPNTLVDYWRMIWETEVLVIVMACNEREAGKYKCESYWPVNTDETQQYGNITGKSISCLISINCILICYLISPYLVEHVKWRQVCPDFLVRTFKVKSDQEERTICQFHYTTWPDHGVPSSVTPILELVRLMRDVQSTESRPILVHCSAGCGRTGTLCSIDYVWALLRTGKLREDFSLFEIICDMRRQRTSMVQTLEQYILCYKAVATLFEQHLKLIDAHTYENIDLNGDPLAIEVSSLKNILDSIIQNNDNQSIENNYEDDNQSKDLDVQQCSKPQFQHQLEIQQSRSVKQHVPSEHVLRKQSNKSFTLNSAKLSVYKQQHLSLDDLELDDNTTLKVRMATLCQCSPAGRHFRSVPGSIASSAPSWRHSIWT
ncbi:hypothetical protein RI129_000127 [Pyrocoelia pectoralis]|uniref:protein-tyrosine-phosphatase n=1 Tax=Pyrocoelia pectoralis TaxID=417401 RepID=A0AAN7ZBL7_9COLE